MILRALAGLMVAAIYAALAGGFTFLLWRLTHDPAYPGPMIPNNNEWGRLVVFFMTLTAAVLGCIVALIVSLAQINKTRGALIGGGIGLVLFLFFVKDVWKAILGPQRLSNDMLQSLVLFFVVFPLGLMLTGFVAAAITSRLRF